MTAVTLAVHDQKLLLNLNASAQSSRNQDFWFRFSSLSRALAADDIEVDSQTNGRLVFTKTVSEVIAGDIITPECFFVVLGSNKKKVNKYHSVFRRHAG